MGPCHLINQRANKIVFCCLWSKTSGKKTACPLIPTSFLTPIEFFPKPNYSTKQYQPTPNSPIAETKISPKKRKPQQLQRQKDVSRAREERERAAEDQGVLSPSLSFIKNPFKTLARFAHPPLPPPHQRQSAGHRRVQRPTRFARLRHAPPGRIGFRRETGFREQRAGGG